MQWNTGGFSEYPYNGSLPDSWNTGGFGLALFNGIQLPKYLNTEPSYFEFKGNASFSLLDRALNTKLKPVKDTDPINTVLSADRIIKTNSLYSKSVFSGIKFVTNRQPMVLEGMALSFKVIPIKLRLSMEISMFMTLSLSEQDKKDIAAAIINTTQLTPVKAELVGQILPSATDIANVIVNNPKTLTVAKFVGLK